MTKRPETIKLLPRSSGEVLREMAAYSVFLLVTVLAACWIVSEGDGSRVAAWIVDSGGVLVGQLGASYGLYATVLLGFVIAAYAGEALLDGLPQRYRRWFAGIAVMIGVGTICSTVWVVPALFRHPSQLGVLFAFLPQATLVVVLAGLVGRLLVFDNDRRRAAAEKTRDRARAGATRVGWTARLAFLPGGVVVIAVLIAVLTLVVSVGELPVTGVGGAAALFVIAASVAYFDGLAVYVGLTSFSRSSSIAALLSAIAINVSMLCLAASAWLVQLPPTAAAMAAAVVLAGASAAPWAERAPRPLREVTIRAMVNTSALNSFRRSERFALRELDLLDREAPRPADEGSLRRAAAAFFATLRADGRRDL
ncbi:hypothetical protein [Herbiconiux sp. A18JL235]|uniref:Uncharacterized protein n=1 Tax=Herbiconiux sp. A18JL235 TaxID=3152363 RepID=A0AB39BGQ1_9MICO